MISLWGLLKLLGLPVNLFILVIKYYTVGVPFRKYSRNLLQCLRLETFRIAISMGIFDSYYIAFMSNQFVLDKMVKPFHKTFINQLPGYGTRYDKNSIWLVKQPDRRPDDPILIYIHGGGYFIQTNTAQIESVLSIYKLISPEKRSRLSILLLDYKLASHGHTFPTQMEQLDQTYQNLTNKEYNTNVILMGDSAGGNLSLGYLQHLKKSKLQNVIFPKKLILISPWVVFKPKVNELIPGNSYYDNHDRDMISFRSLLTSFEIKQIIGDCNLDSLQVSPGAKVTAKENWNNIPTINNPEYDIFVITGEDESFRDDILKFCESVLGVPLASTYTYGNSNNQFDKEGYQYIRNDSKLCNVRVYVEPWGVHDSCCFFENHIILKIEEQSRKNNLELDVNDLDDREFYGISRIVRFLNDTL